MTSSRKPAHPPNRDPEGEEYRQHPRPSGRRILFFSFLASAVVHLVVITLPVMIEPEFADRPTTEAEDADELPDALRVLTFRETLDTEPDPEPEPEAAQADAAAPELEVEPETLDPDPEEEEPVEAGVPAPPLTPPPAIAAPEDEDAPRSAAERLQPHMVDPRLWRDVAPGGVLSDTDRARIQVYSLMEEWADSMALLDEAERRALDWTYTDDDGKRWGISPGRLHLGEFSLPLPIHFGTPAGIRDEVERRAWVWEEIERGAASAAVRDAMGDRVREIRMRRNAERADTMGIRR